MDWAPHTFFFPSKSLFACFSTKTKKKQSRAVHENPRIFSDVSSTSFLNLPSSHFSRLPNQSIGSGGYHLPSQKRGGPPVFRWCKKFKKWKKERKRRKRENYVLDSGVFSGVFVNRLSKFIFFFLLFFLLFFIFYFFAPKQSWAVFLPGYECIR